MTNPSLEYMRRIRREEQAKLLDLRRERAVKALRSLDLHGGSHAMLSQIAYAIHPHVGAWDEGACDHLRNVLAELIGDAREAASDAQSRCACGAGGCHRGDESEAVGDLSHNTNFMRQENKTGITDELRKYVSIHETTTTVYTTMPPQMEEGPTHNGKKLLAIADKIDAQFARVCKQQERVLQDTIDEMSEECDKARREVVELRKNHYELQRKCDKLQAKLDELERFDPDVAIEAFGDDNEELRKLLSRAARLLADAERDRDENYHLWMDCKQKVLQSNITVGELTDERDELKEDLFKYDRSLTRSEMECRMYLDLLRDAARDYKALRDKLNLVFGMWDNATNGGTHE